MFSIFINCCHFMVPSDFPGPGGIRFRFGSLVVKFVLRTSTSRGPLFRGSALWMSAAVCLLFLDFSGRLRPLARSASRSWQAGSNSEPCLFFYDLFCSVQLFEDIASSSYHHHHHHHHHHLISSSSSSHHLIILIILISSLSHHHHRHHLIIYSYRHSSVITC